MALFKMRDSWNVWRRKVDAALGGTIEPVKSEDVVYDNTESGLTATNVQGAIDEVAKEIDGCIVIKTKGQITVTADGVMNYKDIFTNIRTQIDAILNTLANNETFIGKALDIPAFSLCSFEYTQGLTKNDTSYLFTFTMSTVSSTQIRIMYGYISSTDSDDRFRSWHQEPSGNPVLTDHTNQKPASGRIFTFYYEIHKTI